MQWFCLWELCRWWPPPPASAACYLYGSFFLLDAWCHPRWGRLTMVAEMEGVRDVFVKRASAVTISCESSGFSEGPKVQGERRAGGRVQLTLQLLLSTPRPRLRRGCCPRAPSEASLLLLRSFLRTCLSSLAPALSSNREPLISLLGL